MGQVQFVKAWQKYEEMELEGKRLEAKEGDALKTGENLRRRKFEGGRVGRKGEVAITPRVGSEGKERPGEAASSTSVPSHLPIRRSTEDLPNLPNPPKTTPRPPLLPTQDSVVKPTMNKREPHSELKEPQVSIPSSTLSHLQSLPSTSTTSSGP